MTKRGELKNVSKVTIIKNITNTDSDIVISHINKKNETDYITLSNQELSTINQIKGIQKVNPIVLKSRIFLI